VSDKIQSSFNPAINLIIEKIPLLFKETTDQLMPMYNFNTDAFGKILDQNISSTILQNLSLLNNTFNTWTTDIFPLSFSPLQELLNTIIKLNESGNGTNVSILALMEGEFENLFSTIKSKTGLTSSHVMDLRKDLEIWFSNTLKQISQTVDNSDFI
jgi:hypothetical protein